MNRIWRIKDPERGLSLSFTKTLNISPIMAQLLVNRGIKDELEAHHFLYGGMQSLHDPHLLKDIEKSVERIRRAIKAGEDILIYGDYDVDGITAITILVRALTYLGAKVASYIPNRIKEGYGLNQNAVTEARQKKVTLIITVDCGISAHEEVKLANELGIDVIITDHHEIKSDILPEAYSIINPFQKSCNYPFKHLSGVGLAYKLAQVLTEGTAFPIEDELDLVALGTVSDLSIQKGENRILTKCGLEKLNNTKKIGLRALIEETKLEGKNIGSSQIGFILGPRINAMGRVGSADVALELLLAEDKPGAARLAKILDKENNSRRKIERDVLNEALEKIKREINFKESRVIVLSNPNWHAGVIGIVASRIVDRFYRPTVMITTDGKKGKGSARSIANFHLFDAINSCKGHLLDFGGHEAACGLSIDKENIADFRDTLNKIAKEKIAEDDLCPSLNIDMELELSELNEKLVEELKLLQPFGPENPKPLFSSGNVYLRNEPRRIAKNGIKMWITDEKVTCEAITFRAESMDIPSKGEKVRLAYQPSLNTWQGVTSLQLDLKDLKVVL